MASFPAVMGIEFIYTVTGFHQTEVHPGCPNLVIDNIILLILQVKNLEVVLASPLSLTLHQALQQILLALLPNMFRIYF